MKINPVTTIPGFVERVFQNSRATIEAHAEPYEIMEGVNEVFATAIELPGLSNHIARVFLGMSHAAFLSAAQLGTSGQLPTLYMPARGCIETAITGFYLSRHPELRPTWFERGETEESRKKAREAFWPAKMKKELKEVNPSVGSQWETFYEASIDYGAHPNVLGFFGSFDPEAADGEGAWLYLQTQGPFLYHALNNVSFAGLTALLTLEYPLRQEFIEAGITRRLLDLQNRMAMRL